MKSTSKIIDKVSIVTVTYNSSRNIVKMFNSLILNEEYINDVIIIENNSPDKSETRKICKSYASKLNLRYILNQNVGFARSCNLGATVAKSKYILFLNPDTELNNNSISVLLNHLQKNRSEIAGGKAINYELVPHGSAVRSPNLFIGLFEFSNLGKLLRIKSAHKKFYYQDIKILETNSDKFVDAVSGAYLLITKNAFEKLRGFDENIFMYLEDVDLGKRANDLGMKVLFCPHSCIWHIGGASSNNKYHIRHQAWFDSRKYYFRKHFGLIHNIILQPIFNLEEILLKKFKSL